MSSAATAATRPTGWARTGPAERSKRTCRQDRRSRRRSCTERTSGRSNPDERQRTIDFDGTRRCRPRRSATTAASLTTTRADVTDSGRGEGRNRRRGHELRHQQRPGEPRRSRPRRRVLEPGPARDTVAILDGSAAQTGDTTTFTYTRRSTRPLPASPRRCRSGSASGSRAGLLPTRDEQCGTGSAQSSLVDVNGTRLTSCAGNYDDGFGSDGALITVGGVGDSTANPTDPLQQPADGGMPRDHGRRAVRHRAVHRAKATRSSRSRPRTPPRTTTSSSRSSRSPPRRASERPRPGRTWKSRRRTTTRARHAPPATSTGEASSIRSTWPFHRARSTR